MLARRIAGVAGFFLCRAKGQFAGFGGDRLLLKPDLLGFGSGNAAGFTLGRPGDPQGFQLNRLGRER